MIMRVLYQILFLFLTCFAHAQSNDIDMFYSRNHFGFYLNFDSLFKFHDALKLPGETYFCKTDSIQAKNKKFEVKKSNFTMQVLPIVTSVHGIELTTKKIQTDNQLGTTWIVNNNKLTVRLNYIASFQNLSEIERNPANGYLLTDTTGIINHWGKYRKINENYGAYHQLTGYVKYEFAKYLSITAGRDKNFVGDGYRSLFLSENANAYPFLRINSEFWRIKYFWMLSSLKDIYEGTENSLIINSDLSNSNHLYEKYTATHVASLNLGKRLNIYVFETVIWAGNDSVGYRGVDANYMNPLIFFRPVEYQLGSPDNVLLGLGGKWNILKFTQLYGQLLLDEFFLKEVKARNGWWGNKFGIQTGAKLSLPIANGFIFLQGEANMVRPFTYSHQLTTENYGHFYQPLAHPLGANFKEVVGIAAYSKNKWIVQAKIVINSQGIEGDSTNINFGGNIYKSYETRRGLQTDTETGYTIANGYLNKTKYLECKISYIINKTWNMRLESGFILRQQTCMTMGYNQKYMGVFAGFRTCIYNQSRDY